MGLFSFHDPFLSPQDRRVQKERRLQTILLAFMVPIVSGGAFWVARTFWDMSKQSAITANELSRISSTMYVATDAMRDVADMGNRIDSNGKRIESLEKFRDTTVIRLDRLERRPAAAPQK